MPDIPNTDDDGDDEEEEDGEDGGDMDDEDEDDQSAHSAKPRRKQKKTVTLTDEQEEAMIAWLKENPLIYDKGKGHYKKKDDKKVMWAEKAAELGLTPQELTTWYETNRTRFGKLTRRKSGQGNKKLTDRQEWVLKSFAFLQEHINRQPSRAAVAVSTFILFL